LGNQFLANVRECEAIAHVVRCFENDDITHVEGSIDPVRDLETLETELMLADLESLEKRLTNLEKKAKAGDKEPKLALDLVLRAKVLLDAGKPARLTALAPEEEKAFAMLQLLTSLPVLYVCNVSEGDAADGNPHTERVKVRATQENAACVVICAQLEAEIAALADDEQVEFLATVGLDEPGLTKLIHAGYDLLGLQTFFTVGPKEARAWTIHKGWTAPQAAGVIHTDFEKGFIRAETISYDDFVANNGEVGAKEAGKMRLEGKDYVVREGDVMHFRFSS
jgi:GTP-binding protein YchF